MRKTSVQRGITLIALIITIIILLILAVVTIGSIKNSNIITYAKNASTDYDTSKNDEEDIIAGYETKIEETIKESQLTYTDGVPIPAGFKFKEGNKNEGLVIENETEGSQFVWIPVENIYEFAKPQSEGSKDYEGMLYDFWSTKVEEQKNYGIGTTNYREPANLDGTIVAAETSYLYDSQKMFDLYNGGIYTETMYQETFNEMVKSVAKYGGFYVGRYETSLNGDKVQSKEGRTPMINISWYEMYNNSKTYTKSGIVSEMIWGCQWDAMMKFIGAQATEGGKVGHESSDFKIVPYKTGGTNYTEAYEGLVPYGDKANNIYDLEGNVYEWTQEGFKTNHRVSRGSYYWASGLPSSRVSNSPDKADNCKGSRLAFYIE